MATPAYALAVLDQQAASLHDCLAHLSTDELREQVDVLGDSPERVVETWQFAAWATRHLLMVEIHARMEDLG